MTDIPRTIDFNFQWEDFWELEIAWILGHFWVFCSMLVLFFFIIEKLRGNDTDDMNEGILTATLSSVMISLLLIQSWANILDYEYEFRNFLGQDFHEMIWWSRPIDGYSQVHHPQYHRNAGCFCSERWEPEEMTIEEWELMVYGDYY